MSLPASSRSPIRLGFLPWSDCAPLAVARETGLFERYGVEVQLIRSPGWATIRDQLLYGEIDAAASIAGLAFSLTLGIGQLRRDVCVPLILSAHGNAITLSKRLPHAIIRSGEGLAAYLAHQWKEGRPLTLAVAHRLSSHHLLLQSWLRQHGLKPGVDVEIIFLPPAVMAEHLISGHLDGYCAGEPWNSDAILSGAGWCVATSSQIASGHPEKVLVASGEMVGERRQDLLALTAALLHACKLCQSFSFRDELIRILSSDRYTGAHEDILRNSFGSTFQTGIGTIDGTDFHLFHGPDLNSPTPDKASWFLAGLRSSELLPDHTAGTSLTRIYRQDLYRAASELLLPA